MPVLFALVALAAFLILVGLGTWQVQRLEWKEALIATIEARIGGDPVPLAAITALKAAGEPIEYRPVTAAGTFDHGSERHFFATHRGASGYYVYTPLTTDDDTIVFVNRGFVPFDRKDPASRPQSQPSGRQLVSGLAREAPPAKPSFVVPDNDVAQNIFYWKDLEAMVRSTGIDAEAVLPFFVDAGAAADPRALPVGGVTLIDLPNNHLQYAVTWYGLAAALAVIAVVFLRRRG